MRYKTLMWVVVILLGNNNSILRDLEHLHSVSPSVKLKWSQMRTYLIVLHQTKVLLKDETLYNLNYTMTYPSLESLWMSMFYSCALNDLAWAFWWLFIPEVHLGCIWSDVLGILLNVNRYLKEIRNVDRRCETKT